jgi:hypothetical protein
VARVSPVGPVNGYPIEQLDALLANGPPLSAADRKGLADDVRAVRTRLAGRTDPWVS